MDQALSLYLLETLPLLDPRVAGLRARRAHAGRVDPREPGADPAQAARSAQGPRRSREMKAEGVEYEERMEELEKLEYPKPQARLRLRHVQRVRRRHPWVGEENIRPKSIAREMFENFRSFADYVREYGLQRARACCCATCTASTRCSARPCPTAAKTDEVRRDGALLARRCCARSTRACSTSGSGCAIPNYRPSGDAARQVRPPGAEKRPPDITRDTKAFTAAIRTRIFTFLRAWSNRARRGGAAELIAAAACSGRAVDSRAAAREPRGLPRRHRAACGSTPKRAASPRT